MRGCQLGNKWAGDCGLEFKDLNEPAADYRHLIGAMKVPFAGWVLQP
jgi:hypothetical protein